MNGELLGYDSSEIFWIVLSIPSMRNMAATEVAGVFDGDMFDQAYKLACEWEHDFGGREECPYIEVRPVLKNRSLQDDQQKELSKHTVGLT